jgi:hypothetical protein
MPPKVNDGAFFDALDAMEFARRETAIGFPWNGVREDRYACEEVIAQMYADAGLGLQLEAPKRPKGVSAIDMLREAAKETNQKKLPPPEEKS